MSRDKTVKTPLFFPAEFKLTNQQLDSPDSPKDVAKKTIEGLIAFSNNLIQRISKADLYEQSEICLSMYTELKSTLVYKKDRTELNKKAVILKTGFIKSINCDLENYYKILNEFSKDDLDRLYLSIYFVRTNNVRAMKADMTEQKLNLLLSLFLEGKNAKETAKKAHASLLKESDAFPMMIESNILGELLKNLKPQLSSSCLRFLEITRFIRYKDSTRLNIELIDYELDILIKKALKIAMHPAVPESLARELLTDLLDVKDIKVVLDIYEHYFLLFSKFSRIFSNFEEIEFLIQQDEQKKKLQSSMESSIQKAAPMNLAIKPELKELQRVENVPEVASVVGSSSSKAEEFPVSTLPQILPEVDASASVIPEVAPVVESPVFIVPQIPLEVKITPIPQIMPASPAVSIIDEESSKSLESTLKDELAEEMKQYTIFQNNYKKKAEEVQKPARKFNTLNLKTGEIQTYRIVMGLEKGTVLLRDLFNLTQKRFGGWIETTKNNRCHLKFKNIYAFIQLPPEPLEKPCNSASGSMHGGGHSSKPSQNHDRAVAPAYLLEEFADAFTRAGFTEVNLGLDFVPSKNDLMCK